MPSSKRRKPKVVLDTNVWISAIIWGGSPAEIVKAAEEGRICIFISEEIISEISRTLAYPKLKRFYEDTGVSRQNLIETVLRVSRIVEVKTKIHVVREDSADDKFLECALDGKADYLVSGDDHLLKIECHKRTRIVTVRQLLKILEKDKQS